MSTQGPEHILKARTSVELHWNLMASVDGEYYSSYTFMEESYDYARQQNDFSHKSPTEMKVQDDGGRESLVHLNANLAWASKDKRLNVSVYGKNLGFWQYGIEANDFQGPHPERTGPMYGAEAKWGF